jgi:uncharacterized iron-regulated membrane protein
MNTLLFFGLIVFVVAAAGIAGVAMWGPEKTVKNRTQFATNPPQPTPLPSLPALADDPPADKSEVLPADSVEPTAAAALAPAPPPKKWKKAPRAPGKKH